MNYFAVLVSYIGMPAVVGLISAISFLFVYLVRKRFGSQWEYLASYIPALNFNLTPGYTILSKFAQALPATLFAAGIGAVTSGGALVPTLLAALAGPLAVLGHELLKVIPWIPYRGETPVSDPVIPPAPKLPTGISASTTTKIIAGTLMIGVLSCASPKPEPCTPADKARIEANYSENVAIKCAAYASLAECPGYPALAAERKKEEIPCR